MDGPRLKLMQSGWSGAYTIKTINFVAVLSRKAVKPMLGADSFDAIFLSWFVCSPRWYANRIKVRYWAQHNEPRKPSRTLFLNLCKNRNSGFFIEMHENVRQYLKSASQCHAIDQTSNRQWFGGSTWKHSQSSQSPIDLMPIWDICLVTKLFC